MGMNLAIVTQTFGATEDQSWLGSSHGTNLGDPITLNAASFASAFPTGVVPSGVVLGKITATGLYAPYAAGNADGTQTPLGHLLTTHDFSQGIINLAAASWTNSSAPLFYHGEVIIAKLPAASGYVAAVATALPLIKYV